MKKVPYKWLALSCTTLGALFSVLSGSMLMISLPDIMKGLNTSFSVIMWIVMGYMLCLTILVPSIGRVADMFGRKKLYVSGFIIFTLTSLLCGLSKTGEQLLIFRLIQSVGGSLMIANSTAIVTDAFPKNELGKALGINSMVISIASVIGPILGGFLSHLGWRYIFYVNVPVGIVGTIWAAIQLKELAKIPRGQKFDWAGTILFTSGLLLFLVALSFGGLSGWTSLRVILLFAISVLIMVAFVYVENITEQPMLDLRLFKTRILAFAYTSILLNGIARGAVTFLLIFYFQGIKGLDPLRAGIFLTPFALSMMIVSPVSGSLSDKYGARGLTSLGLLISAFGLLGFIGLSPQTSFTELVIWMVIMGIGSGMFNSPNTNEIMGSVPPERRGIAAGTRTMMNNAGQVISIALSMAIVSSSINLESMENLFAGRRTGLGSLAVNEFISGARQAFLISMVITLIASFISYLRGPKPDWSENLHEIKEEL
jgi:EmrB/QacA subfamily drug resistance transporter